MTSRLTLSALVLAVATVASAKPPLDTHRLGQRLVEKLQARKAQIRPQTHTTDFATESERLGCITLHRGEMRSLGYPGHAFLCEESEGEVLGAVLNRAGRIVCYISGRYADDACYELAICEEPDTLCVR